MTTNATPDYQEATVLFADIEGYTALMQSDEKQALINLNHFQTELESKVPEHNGEIIQFYGDGCLMTFNSANEAVQCAKELQQIFQNKWQVPVRMGLHIGDVVYKDGNVFGHAVNVASRVESMGIPGAVLMTGNVWLQIQNVNTLQLVSLGKFEFKNVKGALPIYALSNEGFPIPKREEMKGKLKAVQRSKYHYLYWMVPSMVAMLLGVMLWQTYKKIPARILQERIAVLPFTNHTNDSDLNILGDMSADWINTGLMEIGEAEVVSPFTVQTHKASIGILENDPQGRPSFAELTGAKNLITGHFYKEKEDIVFKLELVDATKGNLRFSFGEVRGNVKNKENLIKDLREQVLNYWAARKMIDSKKIKVPKFEAYALYLKALKERGSEEKYMKMLEIDSTFYLVRLYYLNVNSAGSVGKNEPHFDFLERHADQLSEYETAWLHHLKGIYYGDPAQAFNSLNKIRLKYPKDFVLNCATGKAALTVLNNPELALQTFNELPISETHSKKIALYCNKRVTLEVSSLIQLNRTKDATAYLKRMQPFISNLKNIGYAETILFEALASKNEARIKKAYQSMHTIFKEASPFQYFVAALKLKNSTLLPGEIRDSINKDMALLFQQLDLTNPNIALWKNNIIRVTKQVDKLNIHRLKRLPKTFQITNLIAAGNTLIDLEQTDRLPEVISELELLTVPGYAVQSSVGSAMAHYYLGVLYTRTGNNEKALEHLRRSKSQGISTDLYKFQFDVNLQPLFDLAAFKELQKPISHAELIAFDG